MWSRSKAKKGEEERSVNYFFCIFVEVAAYNKRYQNKKHRIAYIDRTVHFFFYLFIVSGFGSGGRRVLQK